VLCVNNTQILVNIYVLKMEVVEMYEVVLGGEINGTGEI
jgi:hypothetical protein